MRADPQFRFTRREPGIHATGNATLPWSRAGGFTATWSGQLHAPTSEPYTFYVKGDGRTQVYLNNAPLISAGQSSGTLTLSAGTMYDLRVETTQDDLQPRLTLEWSTPTKTRAVVPPSALFTRPLTAQTGTLQASSVTLGQNLLENGDFSDPMGSSTYAPNWSGTYKIQGPGRDGAGSALRLTGTAAASTYLYDPLEQGATYAVTVWGKATTASACTVKVQLGTTTAAVNETLTFTSSTWTKQTVTVQHPFTTKNFSLSSETAGGECWLDDVSVVGTAAAPNVPSPQVNLVQEGDFEGTLSAWRSSDNGVLPVAVPGRSGTGQAGSIQALSEDGWSQGFNQVIPASALKPETEYVLKVAGRVTATDDALSALCFFQGTSAAATPWFDAYASFPSTAAGIWTDQVFRFKTPAQTADLYVNLNKMQLGFMPTEAACQFDDIQLGEVVTGGPQEPQEPGETDEPEPVRAIIDSSITPPTVLAGGEVLFSGAGSTGENLTYTWDFGDGTTEIGDAEATGDVSHTYTTPGYYTTRLKVTNPHSPVPVMSEIRIAVLPEVHDMLSARAIALGEATRLDVQYPLPGLEYEWTLPEGRKIISPNASYEFKSLGFHDISLTIYDRRAGVFDENGPPILLLEDAKVNVQAPEYDLEVAFYGTEEYCEPSGGGEVTKASINFRAQNDIKPDSYCFHYTDEDLSYFSGTATSTWEKDQELASSSNSVTVAEYYWELPDGTKFQGETIPARRVYDAVRQSDIPILTFNIRDSLGRVFTEAFQAAAPHYYCLKEDVPSCVEIFTSSLTQKDEYHPLLRVDVPNKYTDVVRNPTDDFYEYTIYSGLYYSPSAHILVNGVKISLSSPGYDLRTGGPFDPQEPADQHFDVTKCSGYTHKNRNVLFLKAATTDPIYNNPGRIEAGLKNAFKSGINIYKFSNLFEKGCNEYSEPDPYGYASGGRSQINYKFLLPKYEDISVPKLTLNILPDEQAPSEKRQLFVDKEGQLIAQFNVSERDITSDGNIEIKIPLYAVDANGNLDTGVYGSPYLAPNNENLLMEGIVFNRGIAEVETIINIESLGNGSIDPSRFTRYGLDGNISEISFGSQSPKDLNSTTLAMSHKTASINTLNNTVLLPQNLAGETLNRIYLGGSANARQAIDKFLKNYDGSVTNIVVGLAPIVGDGSDLLMQAYYAANRKNVDYVIVTLGTIGLVMDATTLGTLDFTAPIKALYKYGGTTARAVVKESVDRWRTRPIQENFNSIKNNYSFMMDVALNKGDVRVVGNALELAVEGKGTPTQGLLHFTSTYNTFKSGNLWPKIKGINQKIKVAKYGMFAPKISQRIGKCGSKCLSSFGQLVNLYKVNGRSNIPTLRNFEESFFNCLIRPQQITQQSNNSKLCLKNMVLSKAKFNKKDLWYGTYSRKGDVYDLAEEYDGAVMTDFIDDSEETFLNEEIIEASKALLDFHTSQGLLVNFSLTGIRDLKEVINGTASTIPVVTRAELLYIRDNWSTMGTKVKWYLNGKNVAPPWQWAEPWVKP
nr:PKD domain-containing protein [Deinococcus betulae]